MKAKRLVVFSLVLALLFSMFTVSHASSSVITVFQDKFENQSAFTSETTSGSFQSDAGRWGPVPSTVSLTSAPGMDGGDDNSLLVGNRNSWGDAVRIRFYNSTIQANKTYRMTMYLKNGDPSKGLWLTPAVSFYGYDGSGGYPSNSQYGSAGVDLGYSNAANQDGWVKYTQTFYTTEDKDSGVIEFHGFGMGIQLTGCYGGFAVMEFFFVTPGGNTSLDSCPYYMDNISIYNITDGTDPEADMIPFDSSVYQAPTTVESVPDMDYQGIKAIYYNSVNYEGNPTKVFAYIGYPAGASPTNKVPAVILIHGGGGTAFPQWVQQWTSRGYAAIAIDTEGHIPVQPCSYSVTTHDEAGPARTGDFDDMSKPLADQWMYQACSAAIKADSLLHADANIDSSKIGICGISWGGIVTSIVISQDTRLAFGVPIYGCGYMQNSEGYFSNVFQNNPTATKLWEPSNWLSKTTIPVLWVDDASDGFFSINSTAKSNDAVVGSNMTVLPFLTHGHEQGWGVQESYAFADSVCKSAPGLIKITKQPTSEDRSVNISVPSGTSAASAQLVYSTTAYTFDANNTCQADWKVSDLAISGDTVNVSLPSGTQAFYVNIIDSRGNTTSSHLVTPDCSNVKVAAQYDFENQQAFDSETTVGDYQTDAGKLGSVPSTVSLTAAPGMDGGNDTSLLVGNRSSWGDSARIRFYTSTIQPNKTYRMTMYLKNGDPSKGLWLTPAVNIYGSDGSGGYPSGSQFGSAGVDLGYSIAANKDGWVKYTQTFYTTEDQNTGVVEFHGFGLGIQLTGCYGGFVAMEFFFVTPGGNTALDSCPFYMDTMSIYDITDGVDPETISKPVDLWSYNVSADNVVTNISPNKTVAQLKSDIDVMSGSGEVLEIKNGDQDITSNDDQQVGTGTVINIKVGGVIKDTYTLRVYGDVNGDGNIDLNDIVTVRDQLLGKNIIDGPVKAAGDLYGEGNITLNDLVGMMSYVSGSGSINQNF